MGHKTTIGLDSEIRDRLKSIRITKRESYDEIITRLLDNHGGKNEC